ncbi:MAG TPA: hypothetical protein VI854_00335 [Acidimicrobiia bacterium]|nr:hypothetical protein [Acidimicrobiia bacterium]
MRIQKLSLVAPAAVSLVAVFSALVLTGLAGPEDDGSRVCAGTMKTVVCVPPEELPEA